MDVQCALNAQPDIWWQASSWERGLPLDAEDPMKKEREAGEHSAIMNFLQGLCSTWSRPQSDRGQQRPRPSSGRLRSVLSQMEATYFRPSYSGLPLVRLFYLGGRFEIPRAVFAAVAGAESARNCSERARGKRGDTEGARLIHAPLVTSVALSMAPPSASVRLIETRSRAISAAK